MAGRSTGGSREDKKFEAELARATNDALGIAGEELGKFFVLRDQVSVSVLAAPILTALIEQRGLFGSYS